LARLLAIRVPEQRSAELLD